MPRRSMLCSPRVPRRTPRKAISGSSWVRASVHAQWHEIILDRAGDRRVPAVGERQRRPVSAEQRVEIDAIDLAAQGREQLLGEVEVELLDIGHLAVAELLKLVAGHRP